MFRRDFGERVVPPNTSLWLQNELMFVVFELLDLAKLSLRTRKIYFCFFCGFVSWGELGDSVMESSRLTREKWPFIKDLGQPICPQESP